MPINILIRSSNTSNKHNMYTSSILPKFNYELKAVGCYVPPLQLREIIISRNWVGLTVGGYLNKKCYRLSLIAVN